MKAKIKIPDTVKDMTVDHLPFYLALAELAPEDGKINDTIIQDMDPIEVADLNTLFFGTDPGSFDKYTKQSNKKMLAEIAISSATHEPGDVRPMIEIGGVKYIWQDDYSKQPVSFHRDIAKADFKQNPLDLVGLCYIEEGMTYNQLGDHNVIMNPLRERGEAFRKHITLGDYLDLRDFFLAAYSVLRPYLKLKEARRKKNLGHGKKA